MVQVSAMDTDPTICGADVSLVAQSVLLAGASAAGKEVVRASGMPRLPFDERNIRIACALSSSLATLEEEAALLDRLIGPELQALFGR